MKTIKTLKRTMLFALLFATLLFTGCKKEKTFDINKLEGYLIFGKYPDHDLMLIEFLPGKKLNIYFTSGGAIASYKIIDDKTIEIDIDDTPRIIIDNGKVSITPSFDISELQLIKKPSTNQLEGKTFAGKYYYPNGNLLHPKFFYTFQTGTQKVGVGYIVGSPVRTNDYELIGNIAARIQPGGDDREMVVLVNGKLESVYYNSSSNKYQYGTLEQQ